MAAYDHGLKPFDRPETLLKEFTIKPWVDAWYKLTLTFNESQTIYRLSDDADMVLETQTIYHRSCVGFNHGMMQGFYFGGECPAPQAVTVCY